MTARLTIDVTLGQNPEDELPADLTSLATATIDELKRLFEKPPFSKLVAITVENQYGIPAEHQRFTALSPVYDPAEQALYFEIIDSRTGSEKYPYAIIVLIEINKELQPTGTPRAFRKETEVERQLDGTASGLI